MMKDKTEQQQAGNNRRDFLKKVGAVGLGLPVLSPAFGFAHAQSLPAQAKTNEKDEAVWLNIIQTTDVHCQIHPHDELFWENDKAVFRQTGGYAYMSTYFKQERAANKNTFIIDTGDMFQGSALSVRTTGAAMQPILNALHYDLYIPGNWEVVYHKRNMLRLMGGLNAPKVCANMYHDLGDGQRAELIFHPYKIWQVAGLKIGFLGYTDHLVPKRQSPNYSKGIVYTKPEFNLKHYVEVLREQEGCAYVILLSHLGLSQQIALSNHPDCEGVDMILGGDTHERVREPIQGKYAKVVEPGAFGSFAGKLQLRIQGGKVVEERYSLEEISTAALKPDPELLRIIEENEAPFKDDIYQVVGYSTLPLYRYFVVENTIDTMILDALKWRLPEIDVVLSNGFRFCPPRSTPDHTGNIPITRGFIYDMLPVDSPVRTGKVTGKQIAAWLEVELNNVFAKDAGKRFGGWVIKFKGMEVSFNAFAAQGQRVQSVKIGGKVLDENRVYSIAACERDGDPDDMLCRLSGVQDTRNTPYTLHDVMLAYLANNSPVSPAPPGNARVLDAPQTLLSQVFGVPYTFR
ncbi:MAG: bifunctional metallophosphatase/5'-nucleotidase [Bacteroidia bacterium]